MARGLEDQLPTQNIKQKAVIDFTAFCYLFTLQLAFSV